MDDLRTKVARVRAFVFRLEPTPSQIALLEQSAGACRALFNAALEQRQTWGRAHRLTRFGQSREVTELRRQFDWMGAVPRECLEAALADLDSAYTRFFKGLSDHPRYRAKGRDDRVRFPQGGQLRYRRVGKRAGQIRLAKIGWVRLRGFRPMAGRMLSATVRKRGDAWFVAVSVEQIARQLDVQTTALGIDRGVAVFAATSDGALHVAPPHFAGIQKRLANAQRQLARRKRGSANYSKTRARIQRLHMRAADARKDYLHKLSTDIAKNHGFVALETLKVGNMTRSASGTVEAPGRNVRQKAGLNRAILDKGWGMFATFLRYKLEERGGELIEVDPAYTSQTCSACGVISRDSRKSQSVFECVACGHTANADTNASHNILRAGHARRACGSSQTTGRKQEPHQEATNVAA